MRMLRHDAGGGRETTLSFGVAYQSSSQGFSSGFRLYFRKGIARKVQFLHVCSEGRNREVCNRKRLLRSILPNAEKHDDQRTLKHVADCTSLPFLIATAYGSFVFPLICLHISDSPTKRSPNIARYMPKNLWHKNQLRAYPY